MKNRKRIGCMLCGVWLCFCACSQSSDIYLEEYEQNTIETETFSDTQVEEEEMEQEELCYVYVCGAVARPGVYALPQGSRIYEAIGQAGGLTEDADETIVNQAEPVTDGMMIRIYTETETDEAGGVIADESKAADGKVNINTASATELMTLPGIGASKAEAIINYREENGGFSKIEDLMNIPGIKEGVFQQMKEKIKVNN